MASNNKRLKLELNQLQIGIFIEIPGKWSAHPFVFNKFKLATTEQIAMLIKAKIDYVYGYPAKSSARPLAQAQPAITADNVKLELAYEKLTQHKRDSIEAMQRYRRTLKACQQDYTKALAQVRALTNKIQSRPLEAINEAQAVIDNLTNQLQAQEDLVLHLVSDERSDNDAHQHNVSVCMLSMLIGNYLGYDRERLIDLGLAGLLHDIGKIKIPSQIFRGDNISKDRREQVIRQHPQYAIDILKLCPQINDNVKRAILEHHEFADGSGYPKRLKADALSENSLIVSLVNYYEKLCFPQGETKEMSPAQALSTIFKYKKNLFDATHLGAFIKTMGVYPPGTYVRLSNEQIGIVITVKATHLLTPHVMVFDETVLRQDAAIIDTDLEKIKVEQAISPDKLSIEIKEYLNPMSRSGIFIGS